MCKFVPCQWRKLSPWQKFDLIANWLRCHNLQADWQKFVQDYDGPLDDSPVKSIIRKFRSYIKFKKLNYSVVVSWMLGFSDSIQTLIVIAKTKWLDDD